MTTARRLLLRAPAHGSKDASRLCASANAAAIHAVKWRKSERSVYNGDSTRRRTIPRRRERASVRERARGVRSEMTRLGCCKVEAARR